MPRGKFGGTTAVRRGGLANPKADKAASKCSSSFSRVYKGTQPSVALNSSGGSQPAGRSPPGTASSGRSLCLVHPSPLPPSKEDHGEALIWASVGVTSGSNPRSGPVPLDRRIVLAVQLIPCCKEQALLLLGCSLISVCWFLCRWCIGWSALPTPFPARGRYRPPSGGTSTMGSDPSSDTVTTLSSSLSEETPNRPVDSLLGVPRRPAAFLF